MPSCGIKNPPTPPWNTEPRPVSLGSLGVPRVEKVGVTLSAPWYDPKGAFQLLAPH